MMSWSGASPPLAEVDPDPGAKALSDLWEKAIARYGMRLENDTTYVEKVIKEISPAREMSVVVSKCAGDFHDFRRHGEKLRSVLTPIADVLSFLFDAGSDAAAAALPGGAFVGAAITGLLDATKKVSELYDAVEYVLGHIGDALVRFKTYLESPRISPELSGSFVESLIVMLDLITIVTKRYKTDMTGFQAVKRRAKDLAGNSELETKVKELQRLTGVQSLQAAAETHAAVRETHASVQELQAMFKEMNAHMTKEELKEELDAFERWIPLGGVHQLHVQLLEMRHSSTCEWIMDEASFRAWKGGKNSVYSILGPAGCGKTTVCALIIERLKEELHSQDLDQPPVFTLAYYIFRATANRDDQNTCLALMNSLVYQIAQASPDGWKYLRAEYTRAGGVGPRTHKQLFAMLRHMLDIGGPSIIVIDALDECFSSDPRSSHAQEDMLKFLREIYELNLPTLRLLVTSRPEPRILAHLDHIHPALLSLKDLPKHREDMAKYINDELDGPTFKHWAEPTRKEAKKALSDMEKSQGMFLWVSLQLRHLEECSPHEITDVLKSLPTGLDETYRGILQRFRPVRSSLPRVQFILGFIAFARRPLTVDEVAAALFFDLTTMKTEPPRRDTTATEADLLRVVPGLIDIVDSGSGRIVQFIHFSVKEYLTSSNLRRDEGVSGHYLDQYSANIAIATLSLAALEPENEPALGELTDYAAMRWHEHIPLDVDGREPENSDYLAAKERRETAERLNGLLRAFLCADSPAFRSWKMSEYAWSMRTPLHCAARVGLLDHVTRLLEEGADCNAFVDGWTPLHHSAFRGVDPCTKALLKHGADPNLAQIDGFTPLHMAVIEQHAAVVQILVEGGADVRVRTILSGKRTAVSRAYLAGSGLTPLHIHGAQANQRLFELLLGRDGTSELVDVPDWEGRTPLHHAAQHDRPGILKSLLRHGANAYAVDAWGNTPLSFAQDKGAEQCIKLLEDHFNRTSSAVESSPRLVMTKDPSRPISTSSLTLHASLETSTSASPADQAEQRFTVEYSVTMWWSRDLQSVRNNCILALTVFPNDDGSASVHCDATLYGINTDRSPYSLLQVSHTEEPYALSCEPQADCRDTAGTTSSLTNGHQQTEGMTQRLLVHVVPGKAASHSPMSFPLPPPSSDERMAFGTNEGVFILRQLVAAAVHFRSCCQNDAHSLNTDDSDSEEQIALEGPPSIDVGAVKTKNTSLYPSPSPKGNVEEQQTSPASVVPERASEEPIERAAAPFAFSPSVLLLCGVMVAAAVVYVGAVRKNR